MVKKKIMKGGVSEESKVWAFLGILLNVVGFIIILLTKKEDKYAMYYGKQGLVLFITGIVAWIGYVILAMILMFVPILGIMLAGLLYIILLIGMLILLIMGIINAFSGEMKPLPIIGHFADKINI